MVLFGDCTLGQRSHIGGHDKLSPRQAVGGDSESQPPSMPRGLGMQATRYSIPKMFLHLLQGKWSLSFSVSTNKFQITLQRLSWLRIELVLPKLSPTRGTALHSREVNNKGLWPTRARKCPQGHSFTLFSMGEWQAPWKQTWKEN